MLALHKVIDLVHVYESLTCSISTQLNSPGKTWKMDINGPGKSRKTYVKESWKVVENHFQCSVCILLIDPFFQSYSRLGYSSQVRLVLKSKLELL